MPNRSITLVTVDYPPKTGGVARYLANLVEASEGRIRVITQDSRRLFRSTWPSWWPMVSMIRNQPADSVVLVSHVFPVGTAAWISRVFGGPKYAIIFHGLDLRLVKNFWKRFILRRICRSATALLCNSESTKHDLQQLVTGVVSTMLTPGVEEHHVESRVEARRKFSIDPEAKIVLSISRLIPRKGIDVALRAMGRIQHELPVQYVVLGDGPDRVRLQGVAEETRTAVRWVRNASDEEKWLWLAAADVFLLPVRDEGDDVEGFGIVFLEAAKAGIPSVAGKSGGASEAVRHERTGLVVKPDSVDEIEAAVKKLLQDEGLCTELGKNGRERAEKDFRWEDRWNVLSNIL